MKTPGLREACLLKPYSYGLKRYMDSSMIQEDGTAVFEIRLPGHKLP